MMGDSAASENMPDQRNDQARGSFLRETRRIVAGKQRERCARKSRQFISYWIL